ncbi:lysine transporter LysE [Burkholderia cenocepacia]|uniref:LysE family translocator n=1 Tax=Burkholderia cenocepacia TaxID=95486 RepID=UPI000F581697|nr:LysE family transporter [Burkholderia cenocepacia]RQV39091.1 lysine transporter LysE [Burkholderia cenocepacia]RQV48600.1 lysine transporter LysE [Burkholderia cenocepacia]RQV80814.1 lysine transporter LysE [Burkholderia cenocepacia]
MSYLPQLATISGVMLLGCISPGPDLLAVTSHALAKRKAGMFAACGIATAHALWATLAVFGLGLVLTKLAWLYGAIRIAGAAYLLYLGVKTLLGLRKPAQAIETSVVNATNTHAYRRGLLVGLTNPKAIAFFGSLFVTILPAHAPLWVHAATLGVVTSISLTWFNTMAIVFSMARVRQGYNRLRAPIDALMGTFLIGLGAKLALDR